MTSIKGKKNIVSIYGIGFLISLIITIIGTALISYFINREVLDINKTSVPVFLTRMIAVSLGAFYACMASSHKRIVTATIHGAACLVVFLAYAIIFLDGHLNGFLPGLISIVVGTFLPCVVGFHKKKGMKQVKYKVRNG